ncbi:MAG: hypothetical protein NTX12_05955 [Actinobacteria bacterium]|nr:hypothetical protein [Actinomycetota bacterium]
MRKTTTLTRIALTALISGGLVFASLGTASAAGLTLTPTPTASPSTNAGATTTPPASTYAQQLEAFKVAQAAYQVALAKWKVDFAAWQTSNKAAIDANNAAFQAALGQFEVNQNARKAKRIAIAADLHAAIDKATADFKTAMITAKTADQKLTVSNAFKNAKDAAAAAQKAALDALGPELVRPTKPVFVSTSPAPIKPIQPVAPIKPEKPAVTPKEPKPTKSEDGKKSNPSVSPTSKENSKS